MKLKLTVLEYLGVYNLECTAGDSSKPPGRKPPWPHGPRGRGRRYGGRGERPGHPITSYL